MADSAQASKASILNAVFQGYDGPPFSVRLWDGWQWFSSANDRPTCTVVVNNPKALTSLIARPNEVTLGEAFIRGDLDVEGDLLSVFQVAAHLFHRPHGLWQQFVEKCAGTFFEVAQWLKHGSENSKSRDRASIAYHYDLPVSFYEPWLGKSLVYSCAYFGNSPQDSLDEAQEEKLDLICKKLRLKAGERFLDIGCGWGSLVLHAAGKRHARAEGITLSQEQAATGRRRIDEAGMGDRCSVELRDYRELPNGKRNFDKIASVGMVEHVGFKNLPLYFGIVHRLLRPGGLFLNHGIARAATSPIPESSFVERYVFPDGRLVTLSETLRAAESQGLEIRDVENLREHYELTLRRWVAGLRQNADRLLQQVSNTTYRIWLLYTAGSAAAFRRGDIGVYQVLLSRPNKGDSGLPLTRNDWYSAVQSNGRI
jgi:cyclopropane-fatty-acyl-phospholipid synthase